MPDLYVRVSNANAAYVQRLKEDSGVSKADVIRILLDEAERRGWSVSPRAGEVVESQ